jgi:uncharacterized membrane protein YadS
MTYWRNLLVTVFGTATMLALPILQPHLRLSNQQLAIWAGASVQEVGQVVAAASPPRAQRRWPSQLW